MQGGAKQGWKKSRFKKNLKIGFFLFKSDFFKNCPESSISSYKLQNL